MVSYRVGGNAELVNEQRGELICPGDEEGFAAAVERLLTAPALRAQCGPQRAPICKGQFRSRQRSRPIRRLLPNPARKERCEDRIGALGNLHRDWQPGLCRYLCFISVVIDDTT